MMMMMAMMLLFRLLMLVIVTTVGPSIGTLMNDTDKQSIIDQINRLREFARSSNMAEMTWSSDLANEANAWTGSCSTSTANLPSTIGINKYVTDGDGSLDILRALSGWACQIHQYMTHAPSCYATTCGAFSQLVWATTTRVGCAYSECRTITDEEGNGTVANGILFACFFSPARDVGNELAWDSFGAVCSRCPSGAGWCTPYGLCRSNCTGPSKECSCGQTCSSHGRHNPSSCKCRCDHGWYGTDCSRRCEDSRKCEDSPSQRLSRIHKRQIERTYLQLCQECLLHGFSKFLWKQDG